MVLLGICGSLRRGSFNRMLMAEVFDAWNGETAEGDIRLPLLDEDQGLPEGVARLADQIAQAAAVVLVTPEYNQSMPGTIKNALDWVSLAPGKPWLDKPVAILSAADGRAGGARAQYALRLAMTPFRPRLLTGPEVAVAHASKEFADGRLVSDRYRAQVVELAGRLRAEAGRGPAVP
ncbi:MAG: NAD(P)H-dependent oxidoreductase [Rhodobacteraceae bacterium]|jgi:chromate reductase|nr:NAD(P)H-dependent oxidoreductase [Paracoccaceae bacterium]